MTEPTLYQIDPDAPITEDTLIAVDRHSGGQRALVPVEPHRDEVWVSETFGAYQVIDKNGTVVDTVTDVRRKVYLGAEIGGDDAEPG